MNPLPSILSDDAKSLIHWLSLGGVQTEISEALRQWSNDAPLPIAPVNAPTARQAVAIPTELDVKFNNINELNDFLRQWKRLGISKTAMHTIVGTGAVNPVLMVICDAPDGSEDQRGEGFIGVGNRLICEALRLAGFQQDTLYMTYLSKWRPPGQKALSPAEISILSPLLAQEIAFVRPKAILALGDSTLKALGVDSVRSPLPSKEFSSYENQSLNYKIPVFTSQKGEFLVKTPGMKKNFWLSIVNFASALRAENAAPHMLGSPSVNYTE